MPRTGRDRINRLRNLPSHFASQSRPLVQSIAFPIKTRPPRRVPFRKVHLSPITTGEQAGTALHGPVAVNTLNRGGRPWFTVNLAVSVHVLAKMTIDAMHPAREMNIF